MLILILLAVQIQQMKHSIAKGDKKKKKETVAQIAVLETELEARHEQELQAFKDQDGVTTVSYDQLHHLIYCKTLNFRVHVIFANFANRVKSRN